MKDTIIRLNLSDNISDNDENLCFHIPAELNRVYAKVMRKKKDSPLLIVQLDGEEFEVTIKPYKDYIVTCGNRCSRMTISFSAVTEKPIICVRKFKEAKQPTLKEILKYDGADVFVDELREIILNKKGSIATIGSMGTGKTTLVRTIMTEFEGSFIRFYDEIAANNTSLRVLQDIARGNRIVLSHHAANVGDLHKALYDSVKAEIGLEINPIYKVDYVIYCERTDDKRIFTLHQTKMENGKFIAVPLVAFMKDENRYVKLNNAKCEKIFLPY